VTTQRWFLVLALLAGTGLLACLTSTAAEKGAAKKAADPEMPPPDPGTDPVSRIALASRLIEYGRATKSPGSLIEAAVILRSVGAEEPNTEAKPTTIDAKGTEVKSAGAPKETPPDLANLAREVLKEAKDMLSDTSKKSKALTALADALLAEKAAPRGAQGGPKYIQNNLRPGQADVWNLKFDRGVYARISVTSPGGNLALVIRNPENLIRGQDWGPNPRVSFIPHRVDGTDFKVIVRNNGGGTVFYRLYTN